MAQTVESINRWSAAWTGLAWAVTWQSAVLVGLAAIVAVLLHRSPPALRYWLWQIVAIKLLLMPFWTMAVPMPLLSLNEPSQQPALRDEAALAAPPADGLAEFAGVELTSPPQPFAGFAPQTPPSATEQLSWQSWLLIAWLLVVLAQFALLAWQRVRLRRLLRQSAPAPEPMRALVAELAGQLGLRRAPTAVVTDADCSFFACGAWRPVLVLPENILPTLDGERLRQVLLHELAHVNRLDLIFGWPVEIARRLLFFHPLVYWLAYRIRLERELACDQVAMAASGRGPADYIETLVHVVTQSSQPRVLKAAISTGLDGNDDVSKTQERSATGKEEKCYEQTS
jgi:beta-lactamase regulating signal transducer with metallopeptidase domain